MANPARNAAADLAAQQRDTIPARHGLALDPPAPGAPVVRGGRASAPARAGTEG
jgi:hypothetical protein